MLDPILTVAKAVAAGHRAPLYTKADFYAEIGKRAEALRRKGETKNSRSPGSSPKSPKAKRSTPRSSAHKALSKPPPLGK
jgi:hypothetical protein